MKFATLLERYRFERYVLDVAVSTLEKGGITSQLETYQLLEPLDTWGFPRYPARTAILAPYVDLCEMLKVFIDVNEVYLREPGSYLGTWINPHTGYYYLDITTSCVDLEEARREAIKVSARDGRRIVALYNALRDQTVYLWDDVHV